MNPFIYMSRLYLLHLRFHTLTQMLRGAALIPVIVLLGRVVNSFNVDHRSPYIMTADSTTANGDSYFGFSIIQHSFGQDYK